MTDPSSNYLAIPPSEDHYQSEICEAVVSDASSHHLRPTRENLYESTTKWTYFFLGCATMLPWNALANATPFFMSRIVDSAFYSIFTSCLSTVFTFTKLICLSYCTVTSQQSSPSRRIYASNIVVIFFIVSLCLSTFVRGVPWAFFSFALFNAVSLAAASSYMGAAVYAHAALLGPSFLQNVLSGQAAIAVAISAVQVVSAAVSVWGISTTVTASAIALVVDESDYLAEGITARIFFGISALFHITTLAAYAWLTRQAFYKSVTGPTMKQQSAAEDIDERSRLVASDDRIVTQASSPIYAIIKRNWVLMFSIAYVFAVTLALYPAITVRVRSVNPAIPPVLFSAVHFLVFNLGDLVGRRVCAFPRFIILSANKILAMSLIRTVFIPLILLCNVYPSTTFPVHPIIDSDVLYMLILFVMGYTTGHISCTAMLVLTSTKHNPGMTGHDEDVDVAAALGATFMMLGLVGGSLSSFGVEAML